MDAVAEMFNCLITHLFQNFPNRIIINFYVSQKAVAELILHAISFYPHIVASLRQCVKSAKTILEIQREGFVLCNEDLNCKDYALILLVVHE